MFNPFKRKVEVEYKKKKLTKGEASYLSRLNDYDLRFTREALDLLIENTIADILTSHLFEGQMDIKSVVWKIQQISSAIDRADKYKNKKEDS